MFFSTAAPPASYFPRMLSLAAARTIIAEAVAPLDPEPTPLAAAHGRVLRADVATDEDLPAFDRSAMDGYAVSAEDRSERFRVIGEIQPGAAPTMQIRAGECARIFTGAQIPAGASQVIMQENVARDSEWITPRERDVKTWIRHRGEDAQRGDVLLRAGTRLGAGELALLAQLGVMQPRVSPAVRVIHFATGNELTDPAATPAAGQIRDSNSTLIAALLAERGAHLVRQRRCGDALETLTAEIAAAGDAWDALLISGGASVGDYDFGTRALEALGFTIHFHQINLRPGKPLVFATRGPQLAFVIPGNPVSHFVTFHTAIHLALERLEAGAPEWTLARLPLAGVVALKGDARETWWPAHLAVRAGRMEACALAWQSSGDLCGLVGANGLVRIAPDSAEVRVGAEVECLLLGALG